MILKELWTKVNIPEVKTSHEYVTELRERLEGPGRTIEVPQTFWKHYDKKTKPRLLEVGNHTVPDRQ